ncbi:MAG: HU family DNA-binding protein [Oscillospiraceae bacterium]
MKKTELINAIAEKGGYSKKDAEKALAAVIDSISDALVAGDKVTLVGFGTFKVKETPERMGINPRTREKKTIPAKTVPVFKAGQALKDAVNK